MPRYWPIRYWHTEDKRRAIGRLLALREQLRSELIPFKTPDSFLLATWNVRDFDVNRYGHGKRLPESFYYIAEIVSTFDLVAIQEVNRDLGGLERLMDTLGRDWTCIMTDTTEGSGGNEERMVFLYDTRRITFRHIAGEVVLPEGQTIVGRRTVPDDEAPEGERLEEHELQFARTPFLVAFQAGWFKFNLCTVHIYFGSASGEKLERRIEEIRQLARFFARRQKKEEEDYILLGDFNIVSPEHETMKALEEEGFVIPEDLKKENTNLKGDKHYDQIALAVMEKQLEIGASGVFDYRKSVLRDDDLSTYFDFMPPDKRDFHYRGSKKGQPRSEAEQAEYYRDEWRTWQMSDHLPMWVQLRVDFTDHYLGSLQGS